MMQIPGIPSQLSVGEVARRCGVPVSTLHFYESEGLISSTRTAGNQRRYARDVLRRVALIRTAQLVGIPLSSVLAALQALPAGRTPTRQDWALLSKGWRDDLDAKIRQLERLRDHLDDCIGCGCLSIDRCKLANPADTLSSMGCGAVRLTGLAPFPRT
jgi:MerR family redox-sensitive transcriptional activator SoxR